ncbi:MAG: hypothetical protein NTU44_12995, partial [Bacteroidetes bacterium]|nr:hypothetical protein [Bacteroidota bacterium]
QWAVGSGEYDYVYDQMVCFGELFSSLIVSHYLNLSGFACKLFDSREMIITDKTYREGKVNWDKTCELVSEKLGNQQRKIALTQGFIAGTEAGTTTTLGREGSDYSAAIFAYALDASELIIWKDVPGLLNADPKYFPDTQRIDHISYKETIELSYYGAGVIHPNTIKPLQNKNIPLYVKSFLNPTDPGTLISDKPEEGRRQKAEGRKEGRRQKAEGRKEGRRQKAEGRKEGRRQKAEGRREGISLKEEGIYHDHRVIPCYIHKPDQWLISIASRDFSFIAEDNLHEIFGIFSLLSIKINLMQNSAISFVVCIDAPGVKK